MADNTTLNAMTGGDLIATDDVGGVKHQRVKVGYGTDGAYADVTAAAGLPITATPLSTVTSAKAVVTTAATRVQLGTNACASLTVRAKQSNTGLIFVGGATVSAANGFELSAGEAVSVDLANTNAVWIDASVSGDGVSYLWVV